MEPAGDRGSLPDTPSSLIANNDLNYLDSGSVVERAMAETGGMALSREYPLSSIQLLFESNDTSALSDVYDIPWLNSNPVDLQPPDEPDWGNPLSDISIEPSSDSGSNLMRSLGISGNHTTTDALQAVSMEVRDSAFNAPSWKPPLRREAHKYAETASEDELALALPNEPSRTTPVDPMAMVIEAQDPELPVSTFDHGSEFTSHPSGGVSCESNPDKVLAKILLGFPKMMVRNNGGYPPFVHHRLYRCEEGDVQEPLAVVFCCVNSLNTAFPSGKEFVHSLMNAERDRLVKGFRLLRDSEVEMIAAVHAMCVYQIIGFFDDSSPRSAPFAELQQAFFLRMARKVVALYMPQLRSSFDSSNFSELAWKKWASAETVRRTFFLIHIINVVACRTEKQNPFFYEELDDDLVMNLPLPAPEKMWQANSAAEWQSALEEELQSGWQPNITAGTIIDGNRRKEYNMNGSGWGLSGDGVLLSGRAAGRGFHEARLASSHEFTGLLIHCIPQRR